MNEVRSTNELPPAEKQEGVRRSDRRSCYFNEVKETETSVFDGIGHAYPAWPLRTAMIDGLASCRSDSRLAGRMRIRLAGSRANVFGGQDSKSIRWMPWHQEAKKDVVK